MSNSPMIGQFTRFGLVGAVGFLIDTGVLYLLVYGAGIGLLAGRVGSFLAAATFTWWGNRTVTFRRQSSSNRLAEWGRFLMVNSVGALVNYGTYAVLVITQPLFAAHPVLAVGAGSLAGLGVNFAGSKLLVFRAAGGEHGERPMPRPAGRPTPPPRRMPSGSVASRPRTAPCRPDAPGRTP